MPVLNEFIDEHPDFSYKGAKAILAFTGYNGVLGYRTDPDLAKTAEEGNKNAEEYGVFNYQEEIEAAKPVVQALIDDGWELASHSYGHISYGSSFEKVKEDADKWQGTCRKCDRAYGYYPVSVRNGYRKLDGLYG